jgi:hypothetical protein
MPISPGMAHLRNNRGWQCVAKGGTEGWQLYNSDKSGTSLIFGRPAADNYLPTFSIFGLSDF